MEESGLVRGVQDFRSPDPRGQSLCAATLLPPWEPSPRSPDPFVRVGVAEAWRGGSGPFRGRSAEGDCV